MGKPWRSIPLVFALLVGLTGTPAVAQEEPPDGEISLPECPDFAGAPAAEDEFTAYGYARACGVDVEVLGLRDIDRRVFAKPDGLLDAQIAVEPQWVRDDAGTWVDIDTTLVGQADGTAHSAATVIDVAVGAGGDAPFVTATDPGVGTVSLTWPGGVLPAPVLDGATATYPEVLPGVDLAVRAEPVGFSWVLVVKSEEVATDPALAGIEIGIEADGLTVTEDPESGAIVVTDAAGRVLFEAGQAIMWDSTEPEKVADVGVELNGSTMTLTPDAAMLADDSVTYPIYIDPPFTSTRKAWANVFKESPNQGWTGDSNWPRSGGMRVGLNTWSDCGDGCGLWRSVITMNIGGLNGRYIHSANVKMLQTHTGGCSSHNLELWRINTISNGSSWNDVDWLYGAPLQTRSVASSNTTSCGSGHSDEWVDFGNATVKTRVQSAADQHHDTISFGVQSADEGNRDAWRRIKTSSVALHVEYYIYPPVPDRLTVNGIGCKTSLSSAPWITSNTPTLSARARSQESEPIYLRMRVQKYGSDTNFYYYRTPSTVAANTTVNHRTTKSVPDGQYEWQARSDSRQTDAVNSGYSGLCYFKVDATNPSKVTVTPPPAPFTENQDLVFGVSASDPEVNGFRSGLARYQYSWNTPVFDKAVTPNGATTITLPKAPAGRHVLYVRAVDNAGNVSETTTRTFFVGRDVPATAMGMWRFEGDTFDDTPHDVDLKRVAGAATVFGVDRDGRAGAAIALDGQTCYATDAPVIDTSKSFSVATWVRLDAAAGYVKILAHSDGSRAAVQIQYDSNNKHWYLSMPSAKTGDFTWRSLGAPATAVLGQWQHVAGTFDADARLMRLYLNGQLVGEMVSGFEPWNADKRLYAGCLGGDAGTGHHVRGAMDQVGLWQGLLTQAQVQAAMKDLPAATELARWEFRDGGKDSSRFGRDLTIPAHLTVGEDNYGRPNGAIELDGQTCLEYPESVVDTDRSFSVGTWVRMDGITQGVGALVSTFGANSLNGFELWTSTTSRPEDYYFGIQKFPGNFGYTYFGKWHHVAFAYDAASHTVTSYFDGKVIGTSAARDTQVTNNPLLVGCSYYAGDNRTFHLDGALHDLRLWRGAVSATDVASMVGNPPVELKGRYRLDGHGEDTSGKAQHLAFSDTPSYTDGWGCDPDGALDLTGTGTAATGGPVVTTDESFTVSAWVRLDSLDNSASFVTAAGQQTTNFRLTYSGSGKRFEFMMLTQDLPSGDGGSSMLIAHGGPTPALNTWYHLVGVYDLRKKQLRLYVSGDPVGNRAGPDHPWRSTGPLVVGAAGTAGGGRWNIADGAVDDIVVWQGVMPETVIRRISGAPVEAGQC